MTDLSVDARLLASERGVAPPINTWVVILASAVLGAGALALGDAYTWRQGALFLTGGALGVVLYHALFGFTSAWRVFIADGRGAGLRAQMLMLAVAVVLFFPALAHGTLFGQPVHVVTHSGWARGIGSSLKVGLECLTALAPTTDGVIVSVCDQPYLSASVFSRLGRTYRGSNATIVASTYGGVAGVPALFDRAVFSELYALPDRHGAGALIAREPDRVVTVPFPKGAIDLDTPAAYEAYMGR